jgi:hypothetical protein
VDVNVREDELQKQIEKVGEVHGDHGLFHSPAMLVPIHLQLISTMFNYIFDRTSSNTLKLETIFIIFILQPVWSGSLAMLQWDFQTLKLSDCDTFALEQSTDPRIGWIEGKEPCFFPHQIWVLPCTFSCFLVYS